MMQPDQQQQQLQGVIMQPQQPGMIMPQQQQPGMIMPQQQPGMMMQSPQPGMILQPQPGMMMQPQQPGMIMQPQPGMMMQPQYQQQQQLMMPQYQQQQQPMMPQFQQQPMMPATSSIDVVSLLQQPPQSLQYQATTIGGSIIDPGQLSNPIHIPPATQQDQSKPIQISKIIAPVVTPNKVEVTFAAEVGQVSLVQGYNGFGQWKIGGVLRVKNKTGKVAKFGLIDVGLEVLMGGRYSIYVGEIGEKFESKVVAFPGVLLAKDHVLNDADVFYGRFEFIFPNPLPPTLDITHPFGVYFRYRLKASAALDSGKRGKFLQNENIHDVTVPYFTYNIVKTLTTPVHPVMAQSHGRVMNISALLPSTVLFPGEKIDIK
ncbi:hypothetical protein HDU76_008113, partial [Blyttiomyces sp. JEL0837]